MSNSYFEIDEGCPGCGGRHSYKIDCQAEVVARAKARKAAAARKPLEDHPDVTCDICPNIFNPDDDGHCGEDGHICHECLDHEFRTGERPERKEGAK